MTAISEKRSKKKVKLSIHHQCLTKNDGFQSLMAFIHSTFRQGVSRLSGPWSPSGHCLPSPQLGSDAKDATAGVCRRRFGGFKFRSSGWKRRKPEDHKNWLVVEPTHLKNMLVKMGSSSSPIFGVRIKPHSKPDLENTLATEKLQTKDAIGIGRKYTAEFDKITRISKVPMYSVYVGSGGNWMLQVGVVCVHGITGYRILKPHLWMPACKQ